MAKRGRPPKANPRSVALGIRITPELRERLDAARREEVERSLNQEIELRLLHSFESEQRIEERFHGLRIYSLMRFIADEIEFLEKITRRSCWEDVALYEQVVLSINTVMEFLKPKGRKSVPKGFTKESFRDFGRRSAVDRLAMWQVFNRAPPTTSQPGFRIDSMAHTLVAQFAKSGRDPLAEIRKSLLDQITEMQEGEPSK